MCWSSENKSARTTTSIGQVSTLPRYIFQNAKDTDYTDLPDGMIITTSGPYDREYFLTYTLKANLFQTLVLIYTKQTFFSTKLFQFS